jgi:hypothetical protein
MRAASALAFRVAAGRGIIPGLAGRGIIPGLAGRETAIRRARRG